jgi:hypothetical protein
MGDRKDQQTRHYCQACKIWIADNKAQRDQHERGARHKTASEVMLEDIARRNKERAQAEAASRAEIAKIEAKAAAAMGGPRRPTFFSADNRAALLDSIALATTAKSIPTVTRVYGDELGHVDHSKFYKSARDKADPRGYGKWEEVMDTQRVVEPTDDDTGRNQKRCHEAEEVIGAQDAADREEATLRSKHAGDLTAFSSASAICAGTESVAIEFKARNSGRAKRRRRGD